MYNPSFFSHIARTPGSIPSRMPSPSPIFNLAPKVAASMGPIEPRFTAEEMAAMATMATDYHSSPMFR
jgi:hypothetical protein